MYRKGTVEDCSAIHRLICELEHKELPYDAFAQIYHAQVSEDRYYCFVCERNSEIIGVLNLRFEGQLHHSSRIAEIIEFAVDPSCRGKGIGAEMFSEACRLAKEHGCTQIELASNQLRADAHRFYQREGMNNFHYKFSKPFDGDCSTENAIGR